MEVNPTNIQRIFREGFHGFKHLPHLVHKVAFLGVVILSGVMDGVIRSIQESRVQNNLNKLHQLRREKKEAVNKRKEFLRENQPNAFNPDEEKAQEAENKKNVVKIKGVKVNREGNLIGDRGDLVTNVVVQEKSDVVVNGDTLYLPDDAVHSLLNPLLQSANRQPSLRISHSYNYIPYEMFMLAVALWEGYCEANNAADKVDVICLEIRQGKEFSFCNKAQEGKELGSNDDDNDDNDDDNDDDKIPVLTLTASAFMKFVEEVEIEMKEEEQEVISKGDGSFDQDELQDKKALVFLTWNGLFEAVETLLKTSHSLIDKSKIEEEARKDEEKNFLLYEVSIFGVGLLVSAGASLVLKNRQIAWYTGKGAQIVGTVLFGQLVSRALYKPNKPNKLS